MSKRKVVIQAGSVLAAVPLLVGAWVQLDRYLIERR